jgi:hypothetical protein
MDMFRKVAHLRNLIQTQTRVLKNPASLPENAKASMVAILCITQAWAHEVLNEIEIKVFDDAYKQAYGIDSKPVERLKVNETLMQKLPRIVDGSICGEDKKQIFYFLDVVSARLAAATFDL